MIYKFTKLPDLFDLNPTMIAYYRFDQEIKDGSIVKLKDYENNQFYECVVTNQ
jgi:hypothetical protein